MIANFLFFLKIIRVFKKHNILKLIEKNIRYKFLFKLFTYLLAPATFNKSPKDMPDGIRISSALNELGPSFIKLGQFWDARLRCSVRISQFLAGLWEKQPETKLSKSWT